MQIAKATQAFLDAAVPAGGALYSETTNALYRAVEPLHSAIEAVKAQIAHLDRLRRAADREEDSEDVWQHFEEFKTKFKAADARAANALVELEGLTDVCVEIDRKARAVKDDIDNHDARVAGVEARRVGVVVLTAPEHGALHAEIAALRDRAEKAEAAIAAPKDVLNNAGADVKKP